MCCTKQTDGRGAHIRPKGKKLFFNKAYRIYEKSRTIASRSEHAEDLFYSNMKWFPVVEASNALASGLGACHILWLEEILAHPLRGS